MARRNRKVKDRQKALQPVTPQASLTIYGARKGYTYAGGQEFHCTISGYCRTQIFEFPGINFLRDSDEPHHEIYASPSVGAHVTLNLVDYFVNATASEHYDISPSLRHETSETVERVKLQQNGQVPVFLIVEEANQLTPIDMVKGECSIADEVVLRDGEKIPMVVGGRDGEKYLTAWATSDGAWPELPNNQLLVNMVLAGVRSGQQTPEPIRKYIDQSCLVTDDGRYVNMVMPKFSARPSVKTEMDGTAFRERLSEIKRAIGTIEQDINKIPHIALLINSMYSDEYKDDAYQRLQYLGLWQSLVEAGPRHLGYQGDIRDDNVVVAGRKTLRELTAHRDDIAHW